MASIVIFILPMDHVTHMRRESRMVMNPQRMWFLPFLHYFPAQGFGNVLFWFVHRSHFTVTAVCVSVRKQYNQTTNKTDK